MRLYVLRHGPAEDHAASGHDSDRALTVAGRERVRNVARALREADEMPRLIVSSPLVRAIGTAEIVASLADIPVEIRRELAPGGDARALVREKIASDPERLMVVGHEPDLADLVERLTGRQFRGGLQKAMVVGIGPVKDAQHDPKMRIRFVLDPKSLEWHYEPVPHTP